MINDVAPVVLIVLLILSFIKKRHWYKNRETELLHINTELHKALQEGEGD